MRGPHTFKFGLNFRKDRITDSSLLEGTHGQYYFSSLTDFATGQLANGSYYSQSFPEFDAAHIRYYSAGLYAQDEWSIRAESQDHDGCALRTKRRSELRGRLLRAIE